MKQIRLEQLNSMLGIDFRNKGFVLGIDLKHKGLIEPNETRYYGGRKIKKDFLLQNGSVAVTILFDDVKKTNSDEWIVCDVNEATHIRKICKYFYTDNTIYATKTDYDVIKNKKELIKTRIKYAINYLVDTAEKLGASDAVAFIFDGFKKGFDAWKDLANNSIFLNQLDKVLPTLNGQPNQLYYTVNATIPNFEPKTFKDALVEQLTSKKWDPNA